MTSLELEQGREVLDSDGVRALLGRLYRADGRPLARGTLHRLIYEHGLPVHRLTARRGSPFTFYADEVRAWVDNRWNRPTPGHRGRHNGIEQ